MSPTDAERPKDRRPILLEGHKVGLALMLKEDIPAVARWNQDLEFTARIGNPGEAHSLEMRQEFYDKHARMRDDSVEFAVLLLSTRTRSRTSYGRRDSGARKRAWELRQRRW